MDSDSDSKPQEPSATREQIKDSSSDSESGRDDKVETFSGNIADGSPKLPDGGWGWMVVLACFICNFIIGKFQLLFRGFYCSHCYFTRLNLKKMGPLQFCPSIFLGIHRNPKQKDFFNYCEVFLIASLTGHGHPGPF